MFIATIASVVGLVLSIVLLEVTAPAGDILTLVLFAGTFVVPAGYALVSLALRRIAEALVGAGLGVAAFVLFVAYLVLTLSVPPD